MAIPNFTPVSQTSRVVLPTTGSPDLVSDSLCFNCYGDPSSDLFSTNFLSGAADQVAYTYKMLGGDVLDIELTPANVYACYEEAVLEYSYLLNLHQAENMLSNVLGNTTGTFNHDGKLLPGSLSSSLGGTHVNLKFPRFDFGYSRRISDGIGGEIGIGGLETEFSASVSMTPGVQDYDLQAIIQSASAAGIDVDGDPVDFSGSVGSRRILVKRVYFETPQAAWRFFGYYGGLNVVGNLSHYGQYSDDSSFEVIPVWQNKSQAMAYEDAIWTRNSHYSYEIKNNKIRFFPAPGNSSPTKMWINFTIPQDAWEPATGSVDIGVDGINNMNTLPFENLPYENINAIGKHWIRRYALACAKGVLGQVRAKFNPVPIPGNETQLNADQLLEESKSELEALREELKDILTRLTYKELAVSDAELVEATSRVQQLIPQPIFTG